MCLEANGVDLRDVVTASQQITWASSTESDVHIGPHPGPEANNADCDDEGFVDGDCQHTDEVIGDVPDDDDIDLVSSLSVIPNEILSHIITPNTRIRFDNVVPSIVCKKHSKFVQPLL